MKLILTGATGMVGSEVLQQALLLPAVTSIVVLSRRPLPITIESPKLRIVIVEDFLHYTEEAKQELAGASACIWMLAIVPRKARDLTQDFVYKVNHEFPVAGLEAMASSSTLTGSRFRFMYTSGELTERDPQRKLWIMSDHRHMRGKTEVQLLELGHQKGINVNVAKFGLVLTASASIITLAFSSLLYRTLGLPSIQVVDLAKALLDQSCGNGLAQDTLNNANLVTIAKQTRDS